VPLLRGETVPWRDEFLYEHRISIKTIPKSEGVRTTRWKYVRYTESDPLVEELYDLQTDPLEERNLANTPQHAERLESMRAKWEELCRSAE
jgi:arylsulfatase A-like enzyme